MKICYIVQGNPKRNKGFIPSGLGVDRYSSEIITRVKKNGDHTSVIHQGGLSLRPEWLISEIKNPIKLMSVQADLFHVTSHYATKSPFLVRKKPLITSIHDLFMFPKAITVFYRSRNPDNYWSLLGMHARFCLDLARNSNGIIVPFNISKIDVNKTLNVPLEKIFVVNLGVDHSTFRPITECQQGKINEKNIFFIGDAVKEEGLDVAIESFAILTEEIKDAKLFLVGPMRGKKSFFVNELVQKHHLTEKVRFVGFVPAEDLPMWYNRASITLFPSRGGFGLPILESMSCGTPVIASDTADVKEVITKGGFLVKPDPKELANCLIQFFQSAKVRRRMSVEALSRSKDFSWDRAAEETITVYRKIAASQ